MTNEGQTDSRSVFHQTKRNKIARCRQRGVSRCKPAGGARLRNALPRGSTKLGLYADPGMEGRLVPGRYRTQTRRNQIDTESRGRKGEAARTGQREERGKYG